ncbi:MAG: enhanced serine sensitivity protein SseB C-terminal domain-containing protein [Pseudomonadota bacterium]
MIVTPLDAALRSAMDSLWQDRAKVVAFYEQLLDTKLFVPARPTMAEAPKIGRLSVNDGITLWVYRRNGDLVLPVFDTTDRLLEWIDSGVDILRFRGSELVQNYCRDMLIAVNPYARESRMLTVPEVQALRSLAAERLGAAAPPRRSERAGAAPATYTAEVTVSSDFLSAARSQLRKQPDVKAAYLVELLDRRNAGRHHLLLMLDVEAGRASPESGISRTFEGIAVGALPKGSRLETTLFDPKAGLGASISNDNVAPFYVRDHAGTPGSRNLR